MTQKKLSACCLLKLNLHTVEVLNYLSVSKEEKKGFWIQTIWTVALKQQYTSFNSEGAYLFKTSADSEFTGFGVFNNQNNDLLY